MTSAELLEYYRSPGPFTELGRFGEQIDAIAFDPASAAAIVQGLLMHEGWVAAYGVTLSDERRAEKQLCGAHAMLDRAEHLDAGPMCNARSPDRRVVGVCRHFATLFVAIARHKQVPARCRGAGMGSPRRMAPLNVTPTSSIAWRESRAGPMRARSMSSGESRRTMCGS
jgi:hypothetical protein